MGRKQGLSTVLVLGAIVLLVAILVGNNMGNRVLGQIATRGGGGVSTPIPLASTPPPDSAANRALWKRRQVLSVATDPAFPDPRITPEPEVTATPRPRRVESDPAVRRTPRAAAKRTDAPAVEATPDTTYTAPPVPLVSPTRAEETIAPDATQSLAPRPVAPRPSAPAANRNFPTLPPVTQPSSNPN